MNRETLLKLKNNNPEEFAKILANKPWDILSKEVDISKVTLAVYFYEVTGSDPRLYKYRQNNVNVTKSHVVGAKRARTEEALTIQVRLFHRCYKEAVEAGLKFRTRAGEQTAMNFAHGLYIKSGGTIKTIPGISKACRTFCLIKKLCGKNSIPREFPDSYALITKYFNAPITKSEIPGLEKVEKPMKPVPEKDIDIKKMFVKRTVTLEGGTKTEALIPARDYIDSLMESQRKKIIADLQEKGQLVEM